MLVWCLQVMRSVFKLAIYSGDKMRLLQVRVCVCVTLCVCVCVCDYV